MLEFGFTQYLENELTEYKTKFCTHTIIDKICVGIVNRLLQICNRVTTLDSCQNWLLLHILRMNGQNLTKIVYTLTLTRSTLGL